MGRVFVCSDPYHSQTGWTNGLYTVIVDGPMAAFTQFYWLDQLQPLHSYTGWTNGSLYTVIQDGPMAFT